jgi:hypothetical protein
MGKKLKDVMGIHILRDVQKQAPGNPLGAHLHPSGCVHKPTSSTLFIHLVEFMYILLKLQN